MIQRVNVSKISPLLIVIALLLAGCDKADPPTDAPTNPQLSEGEGFLSLTWDVVADRTYWVIYNEGTSVSLDDNDGILFDAEPPFFVDSLTNGTQYAVALTSSVGSSAVGPFAATQTGTPRLIDSSFPWTVSTTLTAENLNSLTFLDDDYVVIGANGSVFIGAIDYPSTDPTHGVVGVSAWSTPTTLPTLTGIDLVSVITDGDKFIVLGQDGTVLISADEDPTSWSLANAIVTTSNMNDIGFSGSLYFAVGDGGEIYTNNLANLSANWELRNSGVTTDLNSVAFLGATYVIVGDAGVILTSSDAVNWTQRTSGTTEDLYDITISLDDGIYAIVGDNGTILTSPDLIDWTPLTASAPTANLRDITYGIGDQFVILAENGEIAYSETGADGSWVVDSDIDNMGTVLPTMRALVSNRSYLAVGDNGTIISIR